MVRADDLVEVYVPQNPVQVALLQQLLAEANIEVFLVNDNLENALGDIPVLLARSRFWVRTSQFAAARQICEAFDQRIVDRAHGVGVEEIPFCYHCGETVESQATTCPHCGAEI